MIFNRYLPRPMADLDAEPFFSAEDAWFWYCRSQIARMEGAKIRASEPGATPRPCDPDDIFTAVNRLYKSRQLLRSHLVVLGDYGCRLTPPSRAYESTQAHVWDEALAIITPALKAKGIVL